MYEIDLLVIYVMRRFALGGHCVESSSERGEGRGLARRLRHILRTTESETEQWYN